MATPLRTIKALLESEPSIKGYAMIGALAMGAWIHPRKTRDLDILIAMSRDPEPTVNRINRSLREKGWSTAIFYREHPKLPFRLYGRHPRGFIVDLHFSHLVLAREVISGVEVTPVGGVRMPVAFPEALIALKLLRSTRQDLIDVERLLAEGDVDMQQLRQLAKLAGVTADLNRLLRRAGWK